MTIVTYEANATIDNYALSTLFDNRKNVLMTVEHSSQSIRISFFIINLFKNFKIGTIYKIIKPKKD
jgi:hypothetical protein